MATYGKISEYDESELWTQYVERLEQYFVANDIKEPKKQRAIFLSACGAKTYALVRDLLQPKKPAETDLDEILKELDKHFSPKPSEIVERFKFHNRRQGDKESVAEFIAGLKKLTEHCNFGDTLNAMLRDRLVCGIKDDKVQRKLLSEPKLTFKKAVEMALAMESASKNLMDLNVSPPTPDPSTVHRVDAPETQKACYRCGGRHKASTCRFRDATCFNCDKKGHIGKVCRGEKKETARDAAGQKKPYKSQSSTNVVKAGEEPRSNEESYSMFHLNGKSAVKPLEVEIVLAGKPHKMEIDTGASKSVINQNTYETLRDDVELEITSTELTTYTGEKIPVLGAIRIPVQYGNQEETLPAVVVKGRDWLEVIKINWNAVFKVQARDPQLEKIIEANKEVFEEGLGTLQGMEAKIYVDSSAQPKFVKARPVPYALKAKLELELDRLEQEGIVSPVEFSEWAAPIVPVVKPNGSVRICGDYKCTVNQVSKLDNYPIPKTEDLLATLGGGNKFTKLDMSQAYQQLPLDEESKKYTTINTHKGLYQYNRLPFGVSSAPGIFQRTMENLLQGIPHVVVRLDDILISGKNDVDHLQNLETVLKKLSSAGLKLRREKCFFMVPEVVYCGYVINGGGVKPMADKVEAISKAPEPKDVSQLQAFLGMLNYYHKFLPDVATTLEPLHKLLRKGTKWVWRAEQKAAFEQAKEMLQSAELLVHFDPSKELVLASDASNYGIGAVLSHRMKNGTERPIGYVSRALNAAERNYSTIEKEALAVIFGVKKFHQFLYGHKFTIRTDHKPLEGLLNEAKGVPSQAAPRIQRWALTLAAYEYKISYKPGVANGNADALSRLPAAPAPEEVPQPGETVLLMEHLEGTTVTSQEIREWTKRDPTLAQVLRFTLESWPPTCSSEELTCYANKKSELSVEDGCLLWGSRVVIPPQGRTKVLAELHETHPGVSRMKALARSYVWWPNMDKDVEGMVRSCEECQVHQKAPAEAPLHPWEWPGQPWSRIHIDYAGPYKGEMFLIVVDAHSKWLDVHIMKSTTSAATIEKLREVFATHGLPRTVVSDNGPQFTSVEFAEFMTKNGMRHIRVSPYHPASNGQAERGVRIFKEGFEKTEGDSIQSRLSRFLLRYRITPHSTTGVPPAQLLMRRHLSTKLDLVRPSVENRVLDKQTQQKSAHDHHARQRPVEVDDSVLVRDFREKKAWMPGTVIEKTGPVSSKVQLEDGRVVRRHQDHLRVRDNKQEQATTPDSPEVQPDTPTITPVAAPADEPATPTAEPTRPVRNRQLPDRLKDYVVYK